MSDETIIDETDDYRVIRRESEAGYTETVEWKPGRQPPPTLEEEFTAYKANVQAAMAMRDEVDAARDDWLLDLEFRLIDLEG